MKLSFGHSNAIGSILKELAQQVQDLSNMIGQPDNRYRILPVTNIPEDKEQQRLLAALTRVRQNIEAMCSEFDIHFEPFPVQKKISNMADYMYSVALELRPVHLKGYGELSEEEQQTITKHVEQILDSLKGI
jgi:hypothetical protein